MLAKRPATAHIVTSSDAEVLAHSSGYKFERELGRGAFGVVHVVSPVQRFVFAMMRYNFEVCVHLRFQCVHEASGRRLAAKFVDKAAFVLAGGLPSRVLDEAAIMARFVSQWFPTLRRSVLFIKK